MASDKAERQKEIALYEINAFLGRTTGKKPVAVPAPRKGGGYKAGQRAAIVKRLTDPKNPAASKLEAIRVFILQKLFKPEALEIIEAAKGKPTLATPKTYPPPVGPVRDADLRRLVQFMGEQIGKDMNLPVLLGYHSAMPEMFKGWVAETARARKIKPKEAEQFLARHVTFIAECEGRRFRHCYPIEDMSVEADVTDQEDRAPYQIAMRQETASGLLAVGHATYTPTAGPPKPKGRPPATKAERESDARLAAMFKASGERTVSAFAEKHGGVDANDVRRALNSDAHRKARKIAVKRP